MTFWSYSWGEVSLFAEKGRDSEGKCAIQKKEEGGEVIRSQEGLGLNK